MMDRRAIGVDIGGTNTKIALVAAGGDILRQTTLPTGTHGDPAPFLRSLIEVLEGLVAPGMTGIGLALPGLFAPDGRSVIHNPNTPALVGIDYFALLDRFHLPIRLEQDLNAPALAEYHFGAGRGIKRLMAAAIGTGLGAAVLVDGIALRFAGNTAGDNGHIILVPGGPHCSAGCSGCAEALVATPAIERAALRVRDDPRAASLRTEARDGRIPARAVIAAALAGDPLAGEIVGGIGGWLGQWLASLAPIFLPDRIVVCGGVAEAGEPLLCAARVRFTELASPDYARCTIIRGAFGGQAGVIGAATPFLLHR
ncbi:MAG: ROK family protein [Ardenticatenaceae bacterium]|nr:ROK family protein [Ardenticatenaceae bacterium]